MLMPRLFGESLFDEFEDWMNFPYGRSAGRSLPSQQSQQTQSTQQMHRSLGIMKTDVKETDNTYELAIDLPGFKKEDVHAQLKDGYLTISATQNANNDEQDENGKYLRRERYSGSVSRSFYLGDTIEQEDIHAKFEDGILKLSIDKKDMQALKEPSYIAIEG